MCNEGWTYQDLGNLRFSLGKLVCQAIKVMQNQKIFYC